MPCCAPAPRGSRHYSLLDIQDSCSAGELIFHIFGALAQFERNLIRERTMAGLAAARARGRRGGRKHLLDAKRIAQAKTLYADTSNTIDDICATLGISRTTLWRYVRPEKDAPHTQ